MFDIGTTPPEHNLDLVDVPSLENGVLSVTVVRFAN